MIRMVGVLLLGSLVVLSTAQAAYPPVMTTLTIGGIPVDPGGYTRSAGGAEVVATWTLDPAFVSGPWSCSYNPAVLDVADIQPTPQHVSGASFILAPAHELTVRGVTRSVRVRQATVVFCTVETPQGRQSAFVRMVVVPPYAVWSPAVGN